MRLDKFTLRGQEAIQSAIELAERNQHQQVEPEHLLVVMLEQPGPGKQDRETAEKELRLFSTKLTDELVQAAAESIGIK